MNEEASCSTTGTCRTGFAILVAGLLCCIIGFYVFYPTIRIQARHPSCPINLRQFATAINTYHETYGCYPPAYVTDENGAPLYSWRVLMLPQLDYVPLYDRFDLHESWDGANNAKIAACKLEYFLLCPSDPDYERYLDNENTYPGMTNYVAVVGPNTVWTGTNSTQVKDIRDRTKTILLVETASAVPWAAPRDLSIEDAMRGVNPPSGGGISSSHPHGAYAVFADAHVEFIPDNVPPTLLAALLSRDGGDTDELEKYRQALEDELTREMVNKLLPWILTPVLAAILLAGLIFWRKTRPGKHINC
jgi:hypothetical protein